MEKKYFEKNECSKEENNTYCVGEINRKNDFIRI